MERPIDLLLFDKDPLTHSALEVLLNDDERIRVSGNARDEEEAFRLLEERSLDLLLMDVNINNKTFDRPLQRIKARFPEQKLLALLYEDERGIEGVLRSGADGYFLKDRDLGALPEALLQVYEKGSYRPSRTKEGSPSPEGILSFHGKGPVLP